MTSDPAGIVLISALTLIAVAATGLAAQAFLGGYWYRWRHTRRGHDYSHMGRWDGREHWLCRCGQWFATRRSGPGA